jgi:renalase
MRVRHDVLVVGAGLSGLVAARALHERGADVALLDKGVGCGGRLATRRVGGASVDHGAQFFTVRDDEFAGLVDRWRAEGLPVQVWTEGFAKAQHIGDGPGAAEEGGDGHPRYAVRGGMNGIAKHLGRGLAVTDETRVRTVRHDGQQGWWEVDDGEARWQARRLLLTAPVPQSLALLRAGGVPLPAAAMSALDRIDYAPTIAVLAVLDRPPALPAGGGVQIADGPISWLGDNVAKGASSVPAVTIHAAPGWSAANGGRSDAALSAELLDAAAAWLGDAEPLAVEVKRWRYAQPTTGHDERCLVTDVAGAALAFAGDAFGEAKVEGAARSGLAVARALLS